MGVEMRIFVIPRDNSFRPDGPSLASFVEKLRREAWISDPTQHWFKTMTFKSMRHHVHAKRTGAFVMTPARFVDRVTKGAGYEPLPDKDLAQWFTDHEESDLRIVWPVEKRGPDPVPLRYPLSKAAPLGAESYYDVEIWLAREYAYHATGENVASFADEHCACGASLVDEPEEESAFVHAMQMWRHCPKCGAPFDPTKRDALVRDPWTNEARHVPGGATFRFAFVIDCGKCWPNEQGLGIEPKLLELCKSHFGQEFYEIVEVY